jgi:hypothetical protein
MKPSLKVACISTPRTIHALSPIGDLTNQTPTPGNAGAPLRLSRMRHSHPLDCPACDIREVWPQMTGIGH